MIPVTTLIQVNITYHLVSMSNIFFCFRTHLLICNRNIVKLHIIKMYTLRSFGIYETITMKKMNNIHHLPVSLSHLCSPWPHVPTSPRNHCAASYHYRLVYTFSSLHRIKQYILF